MRVNLYSQNRHIVVIDGIPIQGFAEGDYMQIKVDGNAAEITKGGDGPAMNISTQQGGEITIALQPTSPALGTLYALREEQANNPRLITISLVTGVEEIITASGCAFADMPQFQTGGPTMQGRQFPLKALKIRLDNSAVEAVVGGLL